MKSAFHDKSLKLEIRDITMPPPRLGQLLIKTVVSGTNPKGLEDVKVLEPRRGA